MEKRMKFIILHAIRNAGTYYINVDEVSGIYRKPDMNYTEIAMKNGGMYEVTEKPLDIIDLIDGEILQVKN
jgi:hypothetical protein